MTIKGEDKFKINSTSFSISPSKEGYTLAYSANGEEFTNYEEATPAGENCLVVNCPFGVWYKCVGNKTDVKVVF